MSITVFPDAEALAGAAAESILADIGRARAEGRRYRIALAGGSTPERTYVHLAAAADQDWSGVDVVFSDERVVPLDDPRSNYGTAQRSLLVALQAHPPFVLPVDTDGLDAADAASRYEAALWELFGSDQHVPVFDLVLLGLGDDGHCASLFPNMPSLDERERLCVGTPAGVLPPPVDRVTFTYPLINAARRVMFLVAGEKKADVVATLFRSDGAALPAARVRSAAGDPEWWLDAAAGAQLPSSGR